MEALGGRSDRRGFTFEAYVPTLIANQRFVLESDLAAAAANAEAACRDLDEGPPELNNFEPLARQLLRAESVASSRIEGLVLSHRRLAKAAFSGTHDITAQSVLANIRALERAVELEPSHRAAWTNLGRAYLGLHQTDAAIGAFRKQIDLNAYDQYAYNNLGFAYRSQQKFPEAEAAFYASLEEPAKLAAAHSRYRSMLEAEAAVRETFWSGGDWRRFRLEAGELIEHAKNGRDNYESRRERSCMAG